MDFLKIDRVYQELSEKLKFEQADHCQMRIIKFWLEEKLPEYDIKCDEDLNTPYQIDEQHICARVIDPTNGRYVDIVF